MSQHRSLHRSAPRSVCRHVGFLVFPGFDLLQLSGPLESFRLAGGIRLSILSLEGGGVASSSGLTVMTRPISADGLDTLLVLGGDADQPIPRLSGLADFVCAAVATLRRVAGIGTGVFVLAEAGLLKDRHAAAGAEFSSRFARAYPAVRLNSGRTFINDHGVWTASGAAPGLELCLALIEEDWGPEICRAIATALPVDPAKSRYAGPQDESLTPAEAAERLRAEAARQQVQDSSAPFAAIARAVGFRDSEAMRREFLRLFGQPPQVLRRVARLARRGWRRHKPVRLHANGS